MDGSIRPNLGDAAMLAAFQKITLQSISAENAVLFRQFKSFHPVIGAATFGALLTVPELQSNCIRCEALAHFALALGDGTRTPNRHTVRNAFFSLGKGICGRLEDPAEDVFIASVGTARGNFRIFEGIWESAGFHLQRLMNVVDLFPDRPDLNYVRESVYALLWLSDWVCERAHLSRNILGNPKRLDRIPEKLAESLPQLRQHLSFTEGEIRNGGIAAKHLSPFIFRPSERRRLINETLGHSTLERYPLARYDGNLFLLLPTAISACIRRFVVEALDASHNRETFLRALANEYGSMFTLTPRLGGKFADPVVFTKAGPGFFATTLFEFDRGYFLNVVFYLDTLDGFSEDGLAGRNPDPDANTEELDKRISEAYAEARRAEGFAGGLSVVVGCGIGRASLQHLTRVDRPHWRTAFISAADLFTLSWTPELNPRTLWRTLEARDRIQELGVELHNINGLLNLVAWMRSLEGHLIPHGELPDDFVRVDQPSFVVITQNALRELRHEVATRWDPHVELDVDGRWMRVRKDAESPFQEDLNQPLYAVEEATDFDGPPVVYVTPDRSWWSTIDLPVGTKRDPAYERWRMVMVWLARAVPVLTNALPTLPTGPLMLRLVFSSVHMDRPVEPRNVSYEHLQSQFSFEHKSGSKTCVITVGKDFDESHFNVENLAERAFVEALAKAAAMLAGAHAPTLDTAALADAITRGVAARQTHAFRAQHIRDYVHADLSGPTITIDSTDAAYVKLGLGWQIHSKDAGAYIEGKEQCMTFLNRLVRHLEDELCNDLRAYNREALLSAVVRNHEVAAADRDRWRRTAAAVLALHDDKKAALEVLAQHDFELNAVFLATRLLAEFALCECPLEGGRAPGHIDLSLLMARAAQIFGFGGWSDAIRWDALEPRLRITPLGDVHAKLDFIDDVVTPFAYDSNRVFVDDAVKNYAKNLEDLTPQKSIHDVFDHDFLDAWMEESGVSVDEARIFLDFIEERAIDKNSALLRVYRSELLEVRVGDQTLSKESALSLLDFFTLKPRPHWRSVPPDYDMRDIHPWRFRRRLSVLRKPILQLDGASDPILLVAPGLLRDSFQFVVRNFYRGEYPQWQLKSGMRKWAGEIARRDGAAFNKLVCDKLRELGWQSEPEIKLTKLLRRNFPQDLGDIDVFAWNQHGRVLVIECKDLHYRKTYGEIAEQLSDFRGEIGADGKPDDLLRHLQRVSAIQQNIGALASYLNSRVVVVESHLVFKHPVPVKFALRRMAERVLVHEFDELQDLSAGG